MKHFLLVYQRSSGKLLDLKEYAETERKRATQDRLQRELEQGSSMDIEVVMLSAESLQALHTTHSRYFQSITDLTKAFSATAA